jgi:hypothetical protein
MRDNARTLSRQNHEHMRLCSIGEESCLPPEPPPKKSNLKSDHLCVSTTPWAHQPTQEQTNDRRLFRPEGARSCRGLPVSSRLCAPAREAGAVSAAGSIEPATGRLDEIRVVELYPGPQPCGLIPATTNENAARRTGGAIVIAFPTSRRGPMFGDREPAATTSRHHMAAEAAKFKTSSDPSVDPNPELHDLWIELRKAIAHFSSASGYAADGHDEIARYAALEGVTTLRLSFSQWMGCPEYRKFAKDARTACGNGQPFEMPALLDKGIMRTCGNCAIEVDDCTIISSKVREGLEDALRELASAGASAAPYVVAQAGIAERVLKAKAH